MKKQLFLSSICDIHPALWSKEAPQHEGGQELKQATFFSASPMAALSLPCGCVGSTTHSDLRPLAVFSVVPHFHVTRWGFFLAAWVIVTKLLLSKPKQVDHYLKMHLRNSLKEDTTTKCKCRGEQKGKRRREGEMERRRRTREREEIQPLLLFQVLVLLDLSWLLLMAPHAYMKMLESFQKFGLLYGV